MSDVEKSKIEMLDGRVVLHHADCRDVLRDMADNSIDSVVTDPPYALVSISKRFSKTGRTDSTESKSDAHQRFARGFMGKSWDSEEVAFAETFWSEVLRVLKPGGHVVAFGGTRTYHRLACAIEDAGFEIRDQIGWTYGSGFPKSHNQHGEWEGFGTALKPAWEPICLARKPLDGTVAENLAKWGTGALNIDGCRVGLSEGDDPRLGGAGSWTTTQKQDGNTVSLPRGEVASSPLGRWPANIAHDGSDEVLRAFPDSNGQQGYVGPEHGPRNTVNCYGDYGARPPTPPRIESDKSAARFFYAAKASRTDRNEGLDDTFVEKPLNWSSGDKSPGTFQSEGTKKAAKNPHPTVKPTSLMQWLCRLVTPPGGVILDPFMGSGSTGKAAVLEGFRFVGVEREDEYVPIAQARISWAIENKDKPKSKTKSKPPTPANSNTNTVDLFGDAA